MDVSKKIEPSKRIEPSVYAYIIPQYPPKNGWVKIGYTTREPEVRIKEQSGTIGVETKTLWYHYARFNSGEYFTDHDFHNYLRLHNIEREPKTEWFNFGQGNERVSEDYFMKFTFNEYEDVQKGKNYSYELREEQEKAVDMTLEYAKKNPEGEFLWNAKPRFGKTLTAYDFARKLDAKTVLIVTNRPAIANSWFDDFEKFIAWQTDFKFVSNSESLKDRNPMSNDEFAKYSAQNSETARRMEFISLQDLKGSIYHGGKYNKLHWVSEINWDLLIIDEAHEGIDTLKTDIAFEQIKRKFTLHLSGTPFKAIARGKFSEEQIFNWSYVDEQKAKENWNKIEENPYENLPRLNMFTYQMSNMLVDKLKEGKRIGGRDVDYTFDLNEFFSTNASGKFVYEKDVINWLNTLTKNKRYPFSTEELRSKLKHTFWLLNRVDSAKALAKLLKKHPIFKDYKIIVAAGDGRIDDMKSNEKSLARVKKAIKKYDKTITLSVGQLTTGVTIPEWSGVMMLSNIKSPALYMQAAFRAQNPHEWVEKVDGEDVLFRKENAYVFDFAPERTLILFDNFANDLNSYTASGRGNLDDRKSNIKELLNFFPVIGEDTDGVMKELEYSDVMVMPRKIKAKEIVRRGFMSNLLFNNISRIFGAPSIVLDTLNKFKKEEQGKISKPEKGIDTENIEVDDHGEVKPDNEIVLNKTKGILGDKIYKIEPSVEEVIDKIDFEKEEAVDGIADSLVKLDDFRDILDSSKEITKATKKELEKFKKDSKEDLDEIITRIHSEYKINQYRIEREYDNKIKEATTEYEKKKVKEELINVKKENTIELKKQVKNSAMDSIENSTETFVKQKEKEKLEKEKDDIEKNIRSRLRGFSRTIPSFIMGYGDRDLTLSNFDSYIPDNVFREVTGITIDEFKFLRDGGEYEENGEIKIFEGGLFDEIAFNASIQEFLDKKEELENYFEDHEEDIFDYIPPQETNQIYTPKNVVKLMVEELEKENPGIFDDSSKTFIDIYMKSGLYITEIVKKLYNSPIIKKEIPDDEQRIKHILENQVYGFAPSEIIYNIATRFIFGNLGKNISRKNFRQIDVTPYVKDGKLQDLINEEFGK